MNNKPDTEYQVALVRAVVTLDPLVVSTDTIVVPATSTAADFEAWMRESSLTVQFVERPTTPQYNLPVQGNTFQDYWAALRQLLRTGNTYAARHRLRAICERLRDNGYLTWKEWTRCLEAFEVRNRERGEVHFSDPARRKRLASIHAKLADTLTEIVEPERVVFYDYD